MATHADKWGEGLGHLIAMIPANNLKIEKLYICDKFVEVGLGGRATTYFECGPDRMQG